MVFWESLFVKKNRTSQMLLISEARQFKIRSPVPVYDVPLLATLRARMTGRTTIDWVYLAPPMGLRPNNITCKL